MSADLIPWNTGACTSFPSYQHRHCPVCPGAHLRRWPGFLQTPICTTTVEFLREAVGVVGRELSEELALNSSELRLSEASLSPLLMELLSSQLQDGEDQGQPLQQKPWWETYVSFWWKNGSGPLFPGSVLGLPINSGCG